MWGKYTNRYKIERGTKLAATKVNLAASGLRPWKLCERPIPRAQSEADTPNNANDLFTGDAGFLL